MPVSVGFQAFRPASSFVTWDKIVARQSGTFYTRERYTQLSARILSHSTIPI